MMSTANSNSRKTVGEDLAAVLERSQEDKRPWYTRSHLLRLNGSIFFLLLYPSALGYDGSMMNGLQALPQWHTFMSNPTGAWLGFINAAQALGTVISMPCLPWIVNRFGRKVGIYLAYPWLALGVGLQTGATSGPMFILGRICLGVVSSCIAASAPSLVTEIAYPTHRGIVTSMYNCGWYVGSVIAAWVTYGTRNYATSWAWRIPSLLQIAVPLVSLPAVFFTPESPRWLISKGYTAEAKQFFVKYHGGGDEDSEIAEFQFMEVQRTLTFESETRKTSALKALFNTKGNRHRSFISITIGFFNCWNGVGIVSYYLPQVLATAGITSVTQQTLISGFLQVWNLICAVSAACLVDRAGRRGLWLVSAVGMLCTYICISGLAGSFANTGNKSIGLATVPFLFLYFGFYDIAFTPLAVAYPVEIWPYALRAPGIALTYVSVYISIFFNIFVNPIALDALRWKYYLVYVAILIILVITVYFFYPETRGYTLEEIARVFDKDDETISSHDDLKMTIPSGESVSKFDLEEREHLEDIWERRDSAA